MRQKHYKNIMDSKPLLLDPKNSIFPEDIVIKINNFLNNYFRYKGEYFYYKFNIIYIFLLNYILS